MAIAANPSAAVSALAGAGFVLLSAAASGQHPQQPAPGSPAAEDRPLAAPMMLVPYPPDVEPQLEIAPGVPYASCYRIGRCSLRDLYRYSDRPHRLSRLAPETPMEASPGSGWIAYRWVLVPITPEENIHPRYRGVGEVRAEYAAVGMPIDPP